MHLSAFTHLGLTHVANASYLPVFKFFQNPKIEPVSAEIGSNFRISFGQFEPAAELVTTVLMLNGQDITNRMNFDDMGLVYQSSSEDGAGQLVLEVKVEAQDYAATLKSSSALISAKETTITDGNITFTIAGDYETGFDAAGKAYVVVPPGVTATVIAVDPPHAFEDGALINGVMKNPRRTEDSDPNQGYDGRFITYSESEREQLPGDIMAGDVLVKTIAHRPFDRRNGGFSQISALHVLPQTLPSGAFLASSVTWPGRTAPLWYLADIDAFYAGVERRSATGHAFPPFDVLMDSFDQFNPLYAQISSVASGTGYQNFAPHKFGGSQGNYGAYIASAIETGMLALTTDVYSQDQSKAILRRLVQHGIEWGDPMLYGPSGNGSVPNGGHNQFHQAPTLLALAVTGRFDQADRLMEVAPGNWAQAFQITAELHQELLPHRDPEGLSFSRIRLLGAQPGGAIVRLPYKRGTISNDWYQTHIPVGASLVRMSDGLSVSVTEDAAFGKNQPTEGTFDVKLESASPFLQGDEVFVQVPPEWVSVGLYDWSARGINQRIMYSPSAKNHYRGLQRLGVVMALRSMDILPQNALAVEEYMERASQLNNPASFNDYPKVFQPFWASNEVLYDVSQSYFDLHWDAIKAQ